MPTNRKGITKVKRFYNQNKKMMVLFVMYQLAIWSYASLLPMILSKYYGFSDTLLSYLVPVFIISWFAGSTYMNIRLESSINYTKALLFWFSVMSVVSLLSFATLHLGLNKYLYFLLRSADGFSTGVLVSLVMYAAKTVTMEHPKNGVLVSLKSFVTYVIKGGWPILVSAFLLVSKMEASVFLYSFAFSSGVVLFLLYHRRSFTAQYQRVVRRSQGKKTKQRGFFESVGQLKFFFKNNLRQKLHYVGVLAFANVNRPFYDLYMVLFLMNYHGLTIVQTTSMVSMMVFGQASQMVSGYLSDRISLSLIRVQGITLYFATVLLIVCVPEVVQNQVLGMAVFYLFGLSRSFYAQYMYKLELDLVKQKEKINRTTLVHNLVGEAFHYLGYIFLAPLLYLGYGVEDLMYLMFVPVAAYFLIWFFYDRKHFDRVV